MAEPTARQEEIAAAVESAGGSQVDAARALGVSRQFVSATLHRYRRARGQGAPKRIPTVVPHAPVGAPHTIAKVTFPPGVRSEDAPLVCKCGWSGTVHQHRIHVAKGRQPNR